MKTIEPSQLHHRLDSAYVESKNRIWIEIANYLAKFEHVELNREILGTVNSTSSSAPVWPDLFDHSKTPSPEGLLTYRGVNIRITASVRWGWQNLRIAFPYVRICHAIEQNTYVDRNGYSYEVSQLSADAPITTSSIFRDESTGQQLTKDRVLSLFAYVGTYNSEITFNWNPRGDGDSVLRDKLEKTYTRYAKALKEADGEKLKEKVYQRYLKNRYPRVQAFVATLTTNERNKIR